MRPNPCKGWKKRPVEQIEKRRKSNGLMHVSVFVLMNLSSIWGGKKNLVAFINAASLLGFEILTLIK